MKRKSSSKRGKNRVANKRDVTARKQRPQFPLFNVLVAILFWLAVVSLFYSGRLIRPQKLVLGQQAPETLVASIDFNAETLSATQLKQSESAEQVLPVFTIDRAPIERAGQELNKLLPRLKSLPETTDPERKQYIHILLTEQLAQLAVALSPEELLRILPRGEFDLHAAILAALSAPIQTGIITPTELAGKFNNIVANGNVTVRENSTETIRKLRSFLPEPDALKESAHAIAQQLPRENRNEEILRKLIAPWLHANVLYDAPETTRRKKQAVQSVEPVIEPVSRGSVLVRSGDAVTEQMLAWLAAHEKRLSELETPGERVQRLVARGLLLLAGLGLAAALAGVVAPDLLRDRKMCLLLLILAFLPMVFGKLCLYLSVNQQLLSPALIDFLVPPALAVILASILAGNTAGILTGVWSSFALAALLDNSFEVFVLGLLVTVVAVYTTRDVKRRSALFRAGLWIGGINMFVVLVLAMLNQPAWRILLQQLAIALGSGLGSALLASLLLPAFEHVFNITTDITLLELSDLSHPILNYLAVNAPGTYHHSLMMASLAQNAAEAIGANGLQVRVCAYFHDIGKLIKPNFFSENIQFSENPHDDLSPRMSTLVIVSHVKEGVAMAQKHNLPQVVIDGIQQHQGTSLVSVFYHRAKKQQQKEQAIEGSGAAQINDKDFRYEGPRPQTREMAILMLADSCEAASRSLDKPSPVRIASLIADIFEARLHDGQLAECNLTFSELNKVKESFVFSLTNMLHARVAYPKDENNTDKPSEPNSAQPAGTAPTDR